jgi:hypothetical protein
LPAFKRLLLSSLCEAHPTLAARIAELDGQGLGVLHEHFSERAAAVTPWGGRHAFTGQGSQGAAGARDWFLSPVRVGRRLRMALAGLFAGLSRKLERWTVGRLERLFEHVTGKAIGNA